MDLRADGAGETPEHDLSRSWAVVDARLKKLRRERRLVERAILALTAVSRTRESRERRAARN